MAQTVYDVGDPITARIKLGVTPDGSTVVTVRVVKPDGTDLAPPPTPTAFVGDEKSIQWVPDVDGDWVVIWTVAGTGAGVIAKVFNVRALPSGRTRPAWVPFLSQVADHIPRYTVDTANPQNQMLWGTFNGNTSPTDEQAHRHLDQAVVRIVGKVGATVAPANYDLAATIASLFAAASIVRAYTDTTLDLQVAEALEARGTDLLIQLAGNNETTNPPPSNTLPEWHFGDPVSWGNDYL